VEKWTLTNIVVPILEICNIYGLKVAFESQKDLDSYLCSFNYKACSLGHVISISFSFFLYKLGTEIVTTLLWLL
jgi:hypothetical protein